MDMTNPSAAASRLEVVTRFQRRRRLIPAKKLEIVKKNNEA